MAGINPPLRTAKNNERDRLMTHRSLRDAFLLTLAAGALALAACGSVDPYADPITANEKFTADQCDKAHECRDTYPFSPEMFVFFFGDNVAACINAQAVPPEFEQAVVEAIDAGRIIYSPASAKACNEGILALNCDQLWTTEVPACANIFTGTVANGQACTLGLECVSQFCSQQTGVCETF
jgi:hypothetical protein